MQTSQAFFISSSEKYTFRYLFTTYNKDQIRHKKRWAFPNKEYPSFLYIIINRNITLQQPQKEFQQKHLCEALR